MRENDAREIVVKAGKRLVEAGLVARTWGNVSCRINETHFAITPSGRDYMSLTPEEIVIVAVSDCSYSGSIKPSSEKGMHADIYKYNPEVNFIIHTHQENASVVSALGLDSIKLDKDYPLIGKEVICAAYGISGTKKLRREVLEAMKKSKGNAVIMKNHGAVCYGKDEEEAFKAASVLEEACDCFVMNRYMELSGRERPDLHEMGAFAVGLLSPELAIADTEVPDPYCRNERIQNGFRLFAQNGGTIDAAYGQREGSLPKEVEIYNEIYQRHKNINSIIHVITPCTLAVSRAKTVLYPLLDDFAQIVGTKVKTVVEDPAEITRALKKTAAVFVEGKGAICCGASETDATAAAIILEKNCKAFIAGVLFGNAKPINWLESSLMHFVYLKKYSKQIHGGKEK